MTDAQSPGRNANSRGETEEQALDRNFNDLLQELRVSQTGVQILFAFLLTLAFSNRFDDTDSFQRVVYLITLLCSAGATALLIAPVSFHRIVFRQRMKEELVTAAGRMAMGGLALLLVAVSGAILLITDVVLDRPAAWVLAAGSAAWFITFWYVVPLVSRHRNPAEPAD